MREVYDDLFDNFREEIGTQPLLTREEEYLFGRAIQKAHQDITTYLLEKSPQTIENFCQEVPKKNNRRRKIAEEYSVFLKELGLTTLADIEQKDYGKVEEFLRRKDQRFYFPEIIERYKTELEKRTEYTKASDEKEECENSKKEMERRERKWKSTIHKLVKPNIPLVISIAKKYRRRTTPFSDIVSEGYLGLIKAATYFEEERGHKFSVYATPWIYAEIQRFTKREKKHFLLSLDEKIEEDDERDYYNIHPAQTVQEDYSQEYTKTIEQIVQRIAQICSKRRNSTRDATIMYLLMGITHPSSNGNHESISLEIKKGIIVPPIITESLINQIKPHSEIEIGSLYDMTRQNINRIKLNIIASLLEDQKIKTSLKRLGYLN